MTSAQEAGDARALSQGDDPAVLRATLAALRAAWWLPLIGMLLGAGAALLLSTVRTPLYTSSTQFFVSTTTAGSASDALQGSQFSQERVTSYALLLEGEDLAARVIDRLDLDTSPRRFTERVEAAALVDTVLIEVRVSDPSPDEAARIADAIGSEFRELVGELEAPAGGVAAAPVKVTVTDAPEVAVAPSSPRPVQETSLGALAGLLVGAALAVLRARLDRSVRSAEQASAATGVPVIGTVLRDDALAAAHIYEGSPDSRFAEDYRKLRTGLQFLRIDDPATIIMITSALPSEGKTTLAVNLALSISESGQRVVLVEGDLRRPKVTSYLGMVSGVGLTNVLAGSAELDDVIQRHGDRIAVLGGGPTPPNPGELLGSIQMKDLLRALKKQYDVVLVDAPPVLPVADAATLAAATEGVILSARHGHVRREHLHQAATTLRGAGGDLLGVVLNVVPPKEAAATGAGYGYDYEYAPGPRHAENAGRRSWRPRRQ